MFYIDSVNKLAYLDSLNVKVFPSGRRKSELIDVNDKNETRHIPIDPEARLNTEANHRKHSGLNGYKQTYISSWDDQSISLVLAGYLFKIELPDEFKSKNGGPTCVQLIGNYLANNLKDTEGKNIVSNSLYVNILTTDVTFFSSVDGSNSDASETSTEILRDQSFNDEPSTCLDICKKGKDYPNDKATSYYFSGLTFSAEPLIEIINNGSFTFDGNRPPYSLQIMASETDREGNTIWNIYEPSRLPKIDHGNTPDSVKIPGDLHVEEGNVNVDGSVTATEFIVQNSDGSTTNAVTLEVVTDQNVTNQLQFWTKPKPKNKV